MMKARQFTQDVLGVLTLGLLWSAQPAIVKFSAASGTAPTAFLLSASGGVALLLCLFTLCQGRSLNSLTRRWKFYQASALLGFFFPLLTRLYISDAVPLYLLTVAVALTPMFIVLMSIVWLGHKFSAIVLVSLLVGMAGVLLSVIPGVQLGATHSLGKASAVLLIPLFYAVNQVFVYRAYPPGLSPVQVAAGESTHTLLASLIFVLAVGMHDAGSLQGSLAITPAILLWTGITTVEIVAFFWLSARCRPIVVSVSIYASVGFGVVWGWIFFDESVTTAALAGSVLIALSAVGISYYERRRAELVPSKLAGTT